MALNSRETDPKDKVYHTVQVTTWQKKTAQDSIQEPDVRYLRQLGRLDPGLPVRPPRLAEHTRPCLIFRLTANECLLRMLIENLRSVVVGGARVSRARATWPFLFLTHEPSCAALLQDSGPCEKTQRRSDSLHNVARRLTVRAFRGVLNRFRKR